MNTDFVKYVVNPEKVYNEKYLELLNKISRFNAHENVLSGSYPIAGYKYDNDLLIIGREAPWWVGKFSVHELDVKGAEEVFRERVNLPGAYAVRKACPMEFVKDLWGETKYRQLYNSSYNTKTDSFWVCAKEIVKGLGISCAGDDWASYLSLSYLYKISFADINFLTEKLRLLQLEICKELFKLELYMGRPRRILFLTGMKAAKDFLGLTEDVCPEDSIVNLGVFDYGIHRAETVVSANPKKYSKAELAEAVLRGFGVESGSVEHNLLWDKYRLLRGHNISGSNGVRYCKFIGDEGGERMRRKCA